MSQRTHFYQFGKFIVDLQNQCLLCEGRIVPLPARVFHLLIALINNRDRLINRDELLNMVWGDALVEDGNLTQAISILRKALQENENGESCIKTIPKRGYRFIAEVIEVPVKDEPVVIERLTHARRVITHTATSHTDEAVEQRNEDNLSSPFYERLLVIEKKESDYKETSSLIIAPYESDLRNLLNAGPQPDNNKLIQNGTSEKQESILLQEARNTENGLSDKHITKRWQNPLFYTLMVFLMIGISSVLLFHFLRIEKPHTRVLPVGNWQTEAGEYFNRITFSPDGRLMVLATTKNNQSDIFIQSVSSDSFIQVTNDEWQDYSPIWSPDGQEVAYISYRTGAPSLWVVPAFGGSPRPLGTLDGENCQLRSWSKDGSKLYFESRHNLFTLDISSGKTKCLTCYSEGNSTANDYSVSLDESHILFTNLNQDHMELYVRTLTDNSTNKITNDAAAESNALWLPDGNTIVYNSVRDKVKQIFLHDLTNDSPRQLTFSHEDSLLLGVSPDGNRLVYQKSNSLYLLENFKFN